MNLRPPLDNHPRLAGPAREQREVSPSTDAHGEDDSAVHRTVRRLIWAYFWLLLLEGALRKWFLPGLANPLLVVRDPVVVVMYLVALSGRVFPWNGFVLWCLGLAMASAFAAFFVGQNNIYVTLYGLRTSFLHLPLVFLVPKVFTLKDVEKMGKWLLITAIPMAILVTIQFRSSPNAWVNVGVGASEGTQMSVGFGKIRPPGTFSFTIGLAIYLNLLVAFVMARLLKRGSIGAHVAFSAVPAALLMIAVSGSRTVLTSVTFIMVGVGYVCLRKNTFFGNGVRAALVIGLACFLLQFRIEVQQGMIVHENRVTGGGGVRGGLIGRALSGIIEPFAAARRHPLAGARNRARNSGCRGPSLRGTQFPPGRKRVAADCTGERAHSWICLPWAASGSPCRPRLGSQSGAAAKGEPAADDLVLRDLSDFPERTVRCSHRFRVCDPRSRPVSRCRQLAKRIRGSRSTSCRPGSRHQSHPDRSRPVDLR